MQSLAIVGLVAFAAGVFMGAALCRLEHAPDTEPQTPDAEPTAYGYPLQDIPHHLLWRGNVL